MNPEIVRYIEQTREMYNRDAITQNLIDAGYTREDVEAAWREVESRSPVPGAFPQPPEGAYQGTQEGYLYDAPQRQKSVAKTGTFWLACIGFILALYIIPVLVGMADPSGTASAIIGLLIVLAALIAAFVVRQRNRPLSLGLFTGCLVSILIPFVLLVIVFGLCVVGLSVGGFGA